MANIREAYTRGETYVSSPDNRNIHTIYVFGGEFAEANPLAYFTVEATYGRDSDGGRLNIPEPSLLTIQLNAK